jgi:hypothetical protein
MELPTQINRPLALCRDNFVKARSSANTARGLVPHVPDQHKQITTLIELIDKCLDHLRRVVPFREGDDPED